MNKELRLELETQGNLLDTMRAEKESFKGGGGGYHWRRVAIMQDGFLPM
jgi:hypothetical protein